MPSAAFDLDFCVNQLQDMSNNGLGSTCLFLGNLLVTAPALAHSNTQNCATLFYFAEALYANGEHRRAETYYRKALQAGVRHIGGEREVDVKMRVYECAVRRGDWVMACAVLEEIPSDRRSPKIHYALGRASMQMGDRRPAITSMKSVLRAHPLALEAAVHLVSLDCPEEEIADLLQPAALHAPWVLQLIGAYYCVHTHDYQGALERYKSLLGVFGSNAYVLARMGEAYWHMGKFTPCISAFDKARCVDEHAIDGMGLYANALRRAGQGQRINTVASSVLQTNRARAEGWLAMGQYFVHENQRQQALQCAEKAIELEPKNSLCHAAKGILLLEMRKLDAAIAAYREAYSIRRDYVAYQGLVDGYMGLKRFWEAKQMASEALQAMPNSPRAITLMGVVWLQSKNTWPQARKHFERALRDDPQCLDAQSALVHLALIENNYTEAIRLLKDHLAQTETDQLHCHLAKALTAAGRYSEALCHYNKALSLRPNCEAAQQGVKDVEKLVGGDNDSTMGDSYTGADDSFELNSASMNELEAMPDI